MKKLILLILIVLSSSAFAENAIERQFKTDKCTGYAEGTKEQPDLWAHCCVEHDFQMWAGGSKEDRRLADQNLKKCVEETGEPRHAKLIFLGVRIGSMSPIKLKDKKWSHAWSEKRENRPLSEEEVMKLEEELKTKPSELSGAQIENLVEGLRARARTN